MNGDAVRHRVLPSPHELVQLPAFSLYKVKQKCKMIIETVYDKNIVLQYYWRSTGRLEELRGAVDAE